MVDFCVYLFYRAALGLIGALPLRLVFSLGETLGFLAWLLLPNYRRLARRNVEIAFGSDKTGAEKKRIVRRHFQQFGANLLSGIKLNAMPLEEVSGLVATEGTEEVHRLLRAGRPVVLALSHLGNWELFAQILPHHFGYTRLSTVYQKLGNRYLDHFVRQQRARFGVELFDRSEGFQEAIKLLRGGGMIGILSDQHAGDHGLWTPFFGRLASTSPLPGLLCKRTGAALVAASLYTDGAGRWRMVFRPAGDHPNDSVSSLTAKTNEMIAEEIRRAPEDWFWVHNRWKTPWPNWLLSHYKRGLFLPAAMAPHDLQPFRILIRGSNWLGDSIMSMPAVRAIKRGRPDAHITVLAPAKLAAVWELLPEVDAVVVAQPQHVELAEVDVLPQYLLAAATNALPYGTCPERDRSTQGANDPHSGAVRDARRARPVLYKSARRSNGRAFISRRCLFSPARAQPPAPRRRCSCRQRR